MTQNTQWLLVVGIVLGAIGVVVAGSAIGSVVADDPVQNPTGFDQNHADNTAHTHAHDDRYHHDDVNQTFDHHGEDEWQHHHDDNLDTHRHADDDDVRGPQRTGAERHIHGGPCH